MPPTKTCPIILKTKNNTLHILAFRHPQAGCQLVKGTIEPGETPREAAIRELFEEAGIAEAQVVEDWGIWDSGFEGQVWSFHLCTCAVDTLPEKWAHYTTDDGGHLFAFFWQPLYYTPTEAWHPLFQGALRWIQTAANKLNA